MYNIYINVNTVVDPLSRLPGSRLGPLIRLPFLSFFDPLRFHWQLNNTNISRPPPISRLPMGFYVGGRLRGSTTVVFFSRLYMEGLIEAIYRVYSCNVERLNMRIHAKNIHNIHGMHAKDALTT